MKYFSEEQIIDAFCELVEECQRQITCPAKRVIVYGTLSRYSEILDAELLRITALTERDKAIFDYEQAKKQ